nr:Chain C, 8-mer peptide [Homo sapiens]
GEEEGECY